MNTIAHFVIDYLVERGAAVPEQQWQDYDLIASGAIDSFEALSFLLVLNNRYGTDIKPHELSLNGFNKLGTLVHYLNQNSHSNNVV